MSSPCPSCGEVTLAGASFCEACGADLPSGPPCVACGADARQIEGHYCLQCGHRQPGERDHVERVDGRIGGTTDKGLRHHHNEDAMAFADVGEALIMVVCDGVSTTDRSEEASQAAADAALGVLTASVDGGGFDPEAGFTAAAAAAQEAVLAVPVDPGAHGNPSCTFVAAVATPDARSGTAVHVGWLGDSRAYWIGAEPLALTRDHTWALELVDAGVLAAEDAMADRRAHTITRFLGADAVDLVPAVSSTVMDGPGSVLVCSDGLWNYVPDAEDLAARPEWEQPTLLEQSSALTAFAIDCGGHDNITTVIGSFTNGTSGGTGEAAAS